MAGPAVVDSDQHLFETRACWADHAASADREHCLAIVDDEAGNGWLTWRGRRIVLADVTLPGETDAVGGRLQRALRGEPPAAHYDEVLPRAYWDPDARLDQLTTLAVDETVVFPNYGLVWERELAEDLDATKVNMGAWNRWAVAVAQQGDGRLHPVAHLSLRDLDWLDGQLDLLERGGVRLAMIGPGLVDGRRLSHPDHDRAWRAFVEHGVTPVFHVANVVRPFADAWFETDPEPTNPALASVFLWAGAALGLADLVVNGVFDRHPHLRIGVMELSAVWVPLFLQYLDGGVRFHERLHGKPITELALPPSEYVRQHARIAAFSYERPDHLRRRAGDLFMFCSDWPHSEGTATPVDDYRQRAGTESDPADAPGLYRDNVGFLLRR
jgi:predicted TIM-barrel fold metal-dependent hydrolase